MRNLEQQGSPVAAGCCRHMIANDREACDIVFVVLNVRRDDFQAVFNSCPATGDRCRTGFVAGKLSGS